MRQKRTQMDTQKKNVAVRWQAERRKGERRVKERMRMKRREWEGTSERTENM